jgi:hypothetical protein
VIDHKLAWHWRATGALTRPDAKLAATFTCRRSNNNILDHTKPQFHTMEDEEDDLYGSAAPEASEQTPANGDAQVKPEQVDASEGSDEDSDDVRNHLRIHSTRNQPNQILLYRIFKLPQSDQKA